MSVGNPRNEALNAAVAALVSDGIFVAVASHNFGTDAYNYSPGSEPTVCTVGASTPEDSVTSVRTHVFCRLPLPDGQTEKKKCIIRLMLLWLE